MPQILNENAEIFEQLLAMIILQNHDIDEAEIRSDFAKLISGEVNYEQHRKMLEAKYG